MKGVSVNSTLVRHTVFLAADALSHVLINYNLIVKFCSSRFAYDLIHELVSMWLYVLTYVIM